MSLFHAVTWIDHQSAQVLKFDADEVRIQNVKTHTHHTRQHGSGVRTEHEFFVGWEPEDHPTEGQLLALARKHFIKYDRVAQAPAPT